MTWEKLGLVYAPRGDRPWARGYAHLPTPTEIEPGIIRVYFTCLDEKKYGRIGFVDLQADDPTRVIREAHEPVLDLGELGSFDDCGVVPSCVATVNGRPALYYIGFQRAERVPYMLFTGLADPSGDSWVRRSRVPVLDRTDAEPFSRSAPWVIPEGSGYRVWYWSCLNWSPTADGPPHNVNALMHARSADGVTWHADPEPCLLPRLPDEYALGRPCVLHDGDRYRMWFSARGHTIAYTIGYAESVDGVAWQRDDSRAGIAASPTGWDSEMICYPAILEIAGQKLLFYNGNRHGASGFGVARLHEGPSR